MAKMTISVPDDTRNRMNEVTEPVNWSAIATKAFQHELGEIAKRKQEKDMSAVIDRLRASKATDISAAEEAGFNVGYEWAQEAATYKQLERLYDWWIKGTALDYFYDSEPYRNAATIVRTLTHDGELTDTEANDWWEDAVSHDNDWVAGWVTGATTLFAEVDDKL